MSHRSLLVLPDDTIFPIVENIDHSRKSIHIKMFIFSEPALIDAVLRAHKRNVVVKVMLNPSRGNGEEVNEDALQAFTNAGIAVKLTPPYFKVSHEKSLVIDEHLAIIQTLNWTHRHLKDTRDFAILTTHYKEVREILDCFECDWSHAPFNPGDTARLVWSPGNARARIAGFIDGARHHLFIQNDRYHDMVIIERLVRAHHRGVKIHLMSPPAHSLKKEKLVEGIGGLRILHDVGVKIHCLQQLSLHAKIMIADHKAAIAGSINLTSGSFDERRELAIEVDDDHIIERLNRISQHDWKHSTAMDLSDEGLYEDLEKRGSGGSEKLVLNPGKHQE